MFAIPAPRQAVPLAAPSEVQQSSHQRPSAGPAPPPGPARARPQSPMAAARAPRGSPTARSGTSARSTARRSRSRHTPTSAPRPPVPARTAVPAPGTPAPPVSAGSDRSTRCRSKPQTANVARAAARHATMGGSQSPHDSARCRKRVPSPGPGLSARTRTTLPSRPVQG